MVQLDGDMESHNSRQGIISRAIKNAHSIDTGAYEAYPAIENICQRVKTQCCRVDANPCGNCILERQLPLAKVC